MSSPQTIFPKHEHSTSLNNCKTYVQTILLSLRLDKGKMTSLGLDHCISFSFYMVAYFNIATPMAAIVYGKKC